MIVLGVRCTDKALEWVVIEGDQRGAAAVVEQRKAKIPGDHRGDQLGWVRKEILELLERHAPEGAAVRVAERHSSHGCAEVEGVVQEALASAGLAPVRHVAVTILSLYGVRNKLELTSALSSIPVIEGVWVGCREPVVSAVALLPPSSSR